MIVSCGERLLNFNMTSSYKTCDIVIERDSKVQTPESTSFVSDLLSCDSILTTILAVVIFHSKYFILRVLLLGEK